MKHARLQPPPQPGFYALVGPNAAGKTHLLRSLMGPGATFAPAGADATFAGDTVARQLRMLTIRIALAAQEPLLLLDEPFDGIDTTTRKQVRQQLIDYIAEDPERTIIMTSHRAEDFAGLATHVIQVFDREVNSYGLPLDNARTHFPTITGPSAEIEDLTPQYPVAETATLGPTTRATFTEPAAAATTHLPVSFPTDAELLNLLATTPIHVEPEETDQTPQGDEK